MIYYDTIKLKRKVIKNRKLIVTNNRVILICINILLSNSMEVNNEHESTVTRLAGNSDNSICDGGRTYCDSTSVNRNSSSTELNTRSHSNSSHEHNDNINENNVNIFRYKFTNEFTDELFKFSKVHQYDHRKDFKEAWNSWVEENDEVVNGEIRRLDNLGYDGDIMDKMYKSARYYFRKKSTEKKEPIKRRIYIGSQKELLEAMDEHIRTNIKNENFKPSDSFDEFCKKNVDLLKIEVNQLCRSGITDSDVIKNKIKKTYKNRYFLVSNK